MKLKYYSVLSLCVLGGLLSTPASVWAALLLTKPHSIKKG